jgi:hypothetical protein
MWKRLQWNQSTNRFIEYANELVSTFNEVSKLHVRTIAAILAWVDVALLFANFYFKSELILLMCIAIAVIAVLIYFIPRLRK